ncbi:hypothetical protein AB0M89_12855 [Streptomyces microflavus]|uniref:hypothetical protein n=1 Tax=Streptomyces microflavus TaxID=1919 RepID=UPI003426BE72
MSTAQDLAAAIKARAVQAGESAPTVAGADWRTATVASVQVAAGTVTTTDGVVARRLATYELPAVGDSIIISQSSSGSWIALDRTVPATGDGWQTPTLTAPWAPYSGGGVFRPPRFRRVGGEVILEGLLDTGGTSVSGTQTLFTLPAGYRPDAGYVFTALTTGPAARQMSVLPAGVVQVVSLPAAAIAFLTINCRFSLL